VELRPDEGQPERVPAADERDKKLSPAGEISRGIVALFSRYTGRGPTKARTTLDANVVVVVLEDMLSRGEQYLVAAGEGEAVKTMRRTYQSAMREEEIGLVERVLGREVLTALSDVDPYNNVAVEIFVLERLPETEATTAAEVPGTPS
jgi:uncharacterized protein YbcI